jgi:flavin-dependent dehydrogenase
VSLDLLVVGGGPVGLATALYAVQAGLSVAVVEQRAGVVDKACGEGLMPGALAGLQALGVDPAGHDIAGIRYLTPTRSVTTDFTRGPGRGVRRTVLHTALREAAGRAGAGLVTGTVTGLEQHAGGVVVQVEGQGRLTARHVVAADGLHSPVRRMLGLHRPSRGRRRHGIRQHYRIAPWSDHVEVHWGRAAEAYVTPVADDTVGVAVLTSARGPMQAHLAEFGSLAARVRGAEVTGPARGAGPLRQRVASRVAGRVLLVGDAGGYVDALTGEGLALGLAQAQVAVQAVASGRPQRYPALARRAGLVSTALTHGLLTATATPAGRRAVLGAAAGVPWVFGRAVDALGGTGPRTGHPAYLGGAQDEAPPAHADT